MPTTTYGTGKAMQFSDGTQRQVLELGSKIHYYNPDVTPIFSIFGMKSMATPVPIFEWMEDEYMIKRSLSISMAGESAGADSSTTLLSDTATSGVNGENVIINLKTQAQVETFEVGGIYSVTMSGTATPAADVTHLICIAIGKDVNLTSPSDKSVQFVGAHVHTSLNAYNTEAIAGGTDVIGFNTDTTLTLSYVATAGQFYDNAVATTYYGYQTHSGSNNFGEINFADADYFMVEGGPGQYAEGAAVGVETRKKVRRLKNCTQIFREPYTITGTADASQHYGGSELARLQARKLAKIKVDCENAIMTNGNIALDATSENPKRTFAGFGIGQSAGTGFVKSLDGRGDASLQLAYSSGTMNNMDDVCEYIFHDMVDGSMRKTVFASNKWLKKMSSMVRLGTGSGTGTTAFYDLGDSSQAAGVRVRRFVGAVGELDFIPHPLLNGANEDYALVIDPANFNVRPLAGRDMQLRSDIVKDGRDGQTDEWLVEFGPEARNEQTHAILKLT